MGDLEGKFGIIAPDTDGAVELAVNLTDVRMPREGMLVDKSLMIRCGKQVWCAQLQGIGTLNCICRPLLHLL